MACVLHELAGGRLLGGRRCLGGNGGEERVAGISALAGVNA